MCEGECVRVSVGGCVFEGEGVKVRVWEGECGRVSG